MLPLPNEQPIMQTIMQTVNLQTVNACLLRAFETMSHDVLNIIAEYYYCPLVNTAFRNNRLKHRFLGNVYDAEGENDEESDAPMSLPIHVFANMSHQRMEFTATGRSLLVKDWNSCDDNTIIFESSICGVFTSGNYTLVVTDVSNGSGSLRFQVHFLDARDVSNMAIRAVRNFSNREVIIFAHDGRIISKRSNRLYIYDMRLTHITTIPFADENLERIALIGGNVIVQGSHVVNNNLHYSYYELDLEDYTLEEIHPEDVNEGELQSPLSPHSSEDEDDEEAPQDAAQAVVEPVNVEAVEQRDPNDISHYFVSDEEYYEGMSEEEYYRTSEEEYYRTSEEEYYRTNEESELGKRKSRD